MFSQLPGIMRSTYKFVWENPQAGDEVEEAEKSQPTSKKRKLNPRKHVANERLPFNLNKFLSATSSHRPSHTEFIQICYYCASVGVPREHMALLDNRNSSCPYKEYDRRQPGRDAISRGSIIRYLNMHGKDIIYRDLKPENLRRGRVCERGFTRGVREGLERPLLNCEFVRGID